MRAVSIEESGRKGDSNVARALVARDFEGEFFGENILAVENYLCQFWQFFLAVNFFPCQY